MKRSVNFSSPKKYALLAELRGAHARPVDGEQITPENAARIDAMIAFYDGRKHITPAVILSCIKTQFTKSDRNLANVILAGYDEGWRVDKSDYDCLVSPTGETRKPPRQWIDIFRYIEIYQQAAQ